jgi:hypothetical protein
MLHGAPWNRWNMLGQAILAICVLMLLTRIIAWVTPDTGLGQWMGQFHDGMLRG